MDIEFLKNFVVNGKNREVKAYAMMVTDMLSDKQIEAISGFFDVTLSLKPMQEKVPEKPLNKPVVKNVPKAPPKKEPEPAPSQSIDEDQLIDDLIRQD